MSGQTITGMRKEFWSSFSVPLPAYPLAGRLSNMTLYGELLAGKKILIFGNYNLVFCYRKNSEQGEALENVVITKTFSESMTLTGAREISPDDGEVTAGFSREPRIRFREGKPANVRLRQIIKNMFSTSVWVEVYIDGEINVEIAMPKKETTPEQAPPAALPGDTALSAEDKKPSGVKDNLPDTAGPKKGEQGGAGTEIQATGLPEKEEANTGQLTIDPQTFAELVVKILDQREEKKNSPQADSQEKKRLVFTGDKKVKIPGNLADNLIAWDKIPGRPVPNKNAMDKETPPPKPTGTPKGG